MTRSADMFPRALIASIGRLVIFCLVYPSTSSSCTTMERLNLLILSTEPNSNFDLMGAIINLSSCF